MLHTLLAGTGIVMVPPADRSKAASTALSDGGAHGDDGADRDGAD